MLFIKPSLNSSILIGLIILLITGGAAFAQGSANNAAINYLEAAANDLGEIVVSAYVSVTTVDGQPVTGLTGADYWTVLEDGEPVEATIELANDPMAVILVIDTSGSMAATGPGGLPAIESAKEAARSFINTLADEDRIALFSFNDEIILQEDFSLDHGAALNRVNALTYKEHGGTCLYDTALAAVKKSAEIPQGRRAIILLTDGVDDTMEGVPCSTHILEDVIDEATTKTIRVPIFTVGLGKNINEQELARLASRTGGRSLVARDNPAELSNLFNSIAAQLRNQYLLTYRSEAASGEHVVVVKVERGNVSLQDESRVFIPPQAVVLPEPTPTPQGFIISIQDVRPGRLDNEVEISVDVSQAGNIDRSVLYIDDILERELKDPPFDRFILNTSELNPGSHIIRIEVTSVSGFTAVDKRDLTIEVPPTPVPPSATPPSTPDGATNFWLIIGGSVIVLILFLVGLAIMLYQLFFKKKTSSQPRGDIPIIPPTEDPVNPFLTEDSFAGRRVDQYETVDEGSLKAPLGELIVVIGGRNLVKDENRCIDKSRVIIGRKTEPNANDCDVDIPESAVSRQHAEIEIIGRQATIRDLGSRNGTFLNERLLEKDRREPLADGAVIGLGKEIKLKFKLYTQTMDPFATMDEGS